MDLKKKGHLAKTYFHLVLLLIWFLFVFVISFSFLHQSVNLPLFNFLYNFSSSLLDVRLLHLDLSFFTFLSLFVLLFSLLHSLFSLLILSSSFPAVVSSQIALINSKQVKNLSSSAKPAIISAHFVPLIDAKQPTVYKYWTSPCCFRPMISWLTSQHYYHDKEETSMQWQGRFIYIR